jgi:thymidylate synthase
MNYTIQFSPRNYQKLFREVMSRGHEVVVGGRGTREIVNAHLRLDNPMDRLITDRARKMNFPFGVAEWISFMTGENRVSFFKPFVSHYSDYSTDGVHIDGTYGQRVMESSSIDGVLEELRRDRNTRRAVIPIYKGADLHGAGGKNTPCTLDLQFVIRDGLLHQIVTMRSNDMVWGLTYDVMVFTLIQEWLANQLGIDVGDYLHNAGSLHIYGKDFALGDTLGRTPRWPRTMFKMPAFGKDQIDLLHEAYLLIDRPEFYEVNGRLCQYMSNFAMAGRAFVMRNTNKKDSFEAFSAITDDTIRFVTRPWLMRAGVIDESQRVRTSPRPLGCLAD